MGNSQQKILKPASQPSDETKKEHIKEEKSDDWILESASKFIQKEECRLFLDTFIDENCLIFDGGPYEQIHQNIHQVCHAFTN